MKPLKYAVIGAGYLGKFHAQKYAALADCQLVAVVDTDQETAKQVAEQCHCQALTDYQSLLGQYRGSHSLASFNSPRLSSGRQSCITGKTHDCDTGRSR